MADGSVIIDTELDQSGLKSGLSSMGSTLSKGITAAVAAAGAAITALGAHAVNVGSDFEYAISGVAATMGVAIDEISVLSDKAKELGESTKFTATEAASGFNILAMAGLSLEEQLQAIGATLDLASAGEMSMESAAGYLTTTVKAMSTSMREAGISMDDCTKIADMYAKGATLANTSTAELGEAVSVAASIGGSFNQSLNTITTSLLALAEKGYQGSQAGNYLARAMSDLYSPTDNAKNALEDLGVAIYDEQGIQRDFIDIVNDLNAAFSECTEEEKAMYSGSIFTTAGLKAFNSIAGNSSEQLADLSQKLQDCTGAAQQMAETKLDNLQGDITLLKSAFDGFGISLYQGVNAPLRDLVQYGTSLIGQLTDAVKEGGFTGLAEALGDVLANAVTKIAEYIPRFVELGSSVINSLLDGLGNSSGQIAEIAVNLGEALISGIGSIATKLLDVGSTIIANFAETLAAKAPEIIETLTGAISGLGDVIINSVVPNAKRFAQAAIQIVKALAEGIIKALPEIFVALIEIRTAIIQALAEIIPELISSIGDLVQTLCETLVENIPVILEAGKQLIGALLDAIPVVLDALLTEVPRIIQTIVAVIPTIIQSIAGAVLSLIPVIVDCGIQLLSSLVTALPEIIQSILQSISVILDSIISVIVEAVPLLVQCGIQLLTALIDALPVILQTIAEALPVIITSIIDGLLQLLPMLIECGIQLFMALIHALPQIIVAICDALPAIIGGIIDALLSMLPLIIECSIQLFMALIQALPEIITEICKAMPLIIDGITKALIELTPMLIKAGIELFLALIKELPYIIKELVKAVPQIMSAIISGFSSSFSSIVDVGKNLVKGLWEGIKSLAGWIWDKVSGWAKDLWDGICDFFGIHSPSKLFEDGLGKNLMLGLAKGIDEESDTAVDAMSEVADRINDIDLDDKDFDFSAAIGSARSAVNTVSEDNTAAIKGESNPHNQITISSKKLDAEENRGSPAYVENIINIDGRQAARVITPYVEKELAWREQ